MRFAHFSHHDSYLAGRSGAREGIWRRRREGDLLRNDINPVRGEAACEEGAKGIFCATTSIPCGEERRGRMWCRRRRGTSSARQHQSRAGRSGAWEEVWRRRREGDLLRDSINPVRGGAARGRGYGEEGAQRLLLHTSSPRRAPQARAIGKLHRLVPLSHIFLLE